MQLDLSDNSVTEISEISDIVASNPIMEEDVVSTPRSEAAARLTLQEEHLQTIASLMKDSFQPQVSQIIQDSLQQQLTTMVNSIVTGVLQGLTDKISSLQKENDELKQKVKTLEEAIDSADQYSRRNCLRITGIPATENESTDEIVINLARDIGVPLEIHDIDRSHRLGRQAFGNEPSPRPRDIVVKFSTYRMRAKFYKARVLTKSRGHRGVYVNEHLTKARSKLLYHARCRVKSKQLKSAWSFDGLIFVKHPDDRVQRISSVMELPDLAVS